MKRLVMLAAFIVAAFLIGRAQAPAIAGVTMPAATTLSQCAQPIANSTLWLVCPVIGSGVYSSINGAAYTLLGAPPFPANCPAGTVGPSGITFGKGCQ